MRDEDEVATRDCFILHPSAFILVSCGVAKLVRHRIVNAFTEGSNPSATAKSLPIANCQLPNDLRDKAFSVRKANRQSAIGNRQCS